MLESVGMDELLVGVDLVITGEGRHEPDAMPGKLPDAVLARAAAHGARTVVICADPVAEEGERLPGSPLVFSRRDLADRPTGELMAEQLAELGALVGIREQRDC